MVRVSVRAVLRERRSRARAAAARHASAKRRERSSSDGGNESADSDCLMASMSWSAGSYRRALSMPARSIGGCIKAIEIMAQFADSQTGLRRNETPVKVLKPLQHKKRMQERLSAAGEWASCLPCVRLPDSCIPCGATGRVVTLPCRRRLICGEELGARGEYFETRSSQLDPHSYEHPMLLPQLWQR